MDYIRYWQNRAEQPAKRLLKWLGVPEGTFYKWRQRYGKVNQHNSWIPRDHWLESWEKEAIIRYCLDNPGHGYRRLTYMMLDADVVAVSASTVHRILSQAGLIGRRTPSSSSKGNGFSQPAAAHKHWHVDISFLNIGGTFYYFIGVLDGYSRAIVHWEIRERSTTLDVELVIQRALERHPGVKPRIISDNGPQFIAKEFKQFVRANDLSHVRTSPYYPQSNGKLERFHRSLKEDCHRPGCPLTAEDARRITARYVDFYNSERLHAAIGYITPAAMLAGRAEEIFAERDRKMAAARLRRKLKNREELSDDECYNQTV